MTGYNTDFFTWTQEQTALLRAGQFDALDIANLADEVESMGKSQIRELTNRLAVLIGHLLKWQFQMERTQANERSWRLTIEEQRDRLRDHVEDNPGLKSPAILETALARSWRDGRRLAIRETGLDDEVFPTRRLYTLDELLDPDYWPQPDLKPSTDRIA
ncbi:protein of unknown function DUF29 [Thiocystis violascens DSM 198]|uniref:DUF29 domain-containing protein n=2 Tax=Thiocystis violascens TaxID=73141 RepID=I3YG08_THIV6|nr:protein of unknown function DUF29 [Thiocystis violascens DSM 198]